MPKITPYNTGKIFTKCSFFYGRRIVFFWLFLWKIRTKGEISDIIWANNPYSTGLFSQSATFSMRGTWPKREFCTWKNRIKVETSFFSQKLANNPCFNEKKPWKKEEMGKKSEVFPWNWISFKKKVKMILILVFKPIIVFIYNLGCIF